MIIREVVIAAKNFMASMKRVEDSRESGRLRLVKQRQASESDERPYASKTWRMTAYSKGLMEGRER